MSDKEFTRKIGKAIAVCTTPDVCKSPTVPAPYVSFSTFEQVIQTADSVKMTQCVAFTKNSRLQMTSADEGGVGGGIKSQTFKGMCRPFKEWSSTVYAEGHQICRHDVIMEMNCLGPEGPGNTYGKVFYVESLCCASVSPLGEIEVDEEESDSSSQDESSSEDSFSKGGSKSDSPAAKKEHSQLDGFGEEAGDRIKGEWEGLKQSGKDAYDLATDPQARQDAMDAVGKTVEAAKNDPVGFGMEAGGAIVEDIAEPFGTAYDQAMAGSVGAAGASLGYGILNVFNPFKKLKIAEKIAKMGGKKKRRKNDNDTKKKNDDIKDDEKNKEENKNEENNDGDPEEGKDGGTVVEAPKTKVVDGVTYELKPSNNGKGPNRWQRVDKKKQYSRNMSERRKALLRDADDPNSGLSSSDRKFIKDNNGKKVPEGWEVSHEEPLYTGKTLERKADLDVADNMKTQPKDVHRARHMICGDQYHDFPPGK